MQLSETQPLRITDKNKVLILERNILQKIFAPTKDNITRRIEIKEKQKSRNNVQKKIFIKL